MPTLSGVSGKIQLLNEQWIKMSTITSTASTNLQVYQDLTWNGWVISNTTTGTSTYLTDEQLVRFEGTGITWDQCQPYSYTFSPVQEQVYERWHVMHEREVPSPARLQELEDLAQRQREEASRRRLEAQQREEKAIEDRLMAHARGLELLDMILTPEQREQRRTGRIEVTGSDGGLFVVSIEGRSVHGNVYEVDAHGCHLGTICIAPRMRVNGRALPLSDGWVGQILAIQANEAEFRRTGNWSGRQACRHPDVPILERAA